jgi:hypothetical protein
LGTTLSVNGPKITRNGAEVTKVYVDDVLSVGNLLFPIDKTWSDGITRVWNENDIVWTHAEGTTTTGPAYTVKADDVGHPISVKLTANPSAPNYYYTPGSLLTSNTIAGTDVSHETVYTVAISPSPHGQVLADVDRAVSGDTVTISVLPDVGYTANTSGLAVTGDISTTSQGNGQFTFTMPNNNVTISGVTFIATTTIITLDANTGTPGTPTVATATYDSVLTDLAGFNVPTKAGYIFGGFGISADNGATVGGLIYNAAGEAQADVSGYTDGFTEWTNTGSTLTLYAKWTADTSVTITYEAGTGGTVSHPSESVLAATGTAAGATATANGATPLQTGQ